MDTHGNAENLWGILRINLRRQFPLPALAALALMALTMFMFNMNQFRCNQFL